MKVILQIILLFSCYAYADCLVSVPEALEKLSKVSPQKMQIDVSPVIKDSKYTRKLVNRLGYNNHFQGVILHGNNIYVSGSNYYDKKGQVFIGTKKDGSFQLEREIVIAGNPLFWHAGGMSLLDDKLLVPNEDFNLNKSLLTSIETKQLKTLATVDRQQNDAGAIASIVINDKSYLVVATPEQVDTYTYNDTGFQLIGKMPGEYFNGSNVALIKQCDGKVYYLDLYNTGSLGPWLADQDVADLYLLEKIQTSSPKLIKVKKYEFNCSRDCNFSAGSSVGISDDSLQLYSVRHFHENGKLELNVFSLGNTPAIAAD